MFHSLKCESLIFRGDKLLISLFYYTMRDKNGFLLIRFVNSKNDIRFVNNVKWVEPLLGFCLICINPAVFRKEMAIKNRKGKVRE